ncbi:nucleoside monophosphate kinase [Patescibacteria group bacterium]|nr:nucleoside monophosphate kinase [Patescibacteria group bacterium]
MHINTFFMMGRPGSGKGTQTKLLAEKLGAQTFSSGGRYREIASADTFIGQKIKGIIDSGALTPSWFAVFLFTESILKLPSLETPIVYEGAGRKPEEAKRIDEILGWLDRPYAVIHLDVSEDEIRNRLTKRAELEGRKDDSAKSIEVRLKAYAEDTEHSIEFFRSVGKTIEINGNQSEEAVFAEIEAKIAQLS